VLRKIRGACRTAASRPPSGSGVHGVHLNVARRRTVRLCFSHGAALLRMHPRQFLPRMIQPASGSGCNGELRILMIRILDSDRGRISTSASARFSGASEAPAPEVGSKKSGCFRLDLPRCLRFHPRETLVTARAGRVNRASRGRTNPRGMGQPGPDFDAADHDPPAHRRLTLFPRLPSVATTPRQFGGSNC
jgi:hypothetical protein